MSRIAAPFLAVILFVSVFVTASLGSETRWTVRLNLYYGTIGGTPMDYVFFGVRPADPGECLIPEGCCSKQDPLPPYVYLYWYRPTWTDQAIKDGCAYRRPLSPGSVTTWDDLRAQSSLNGTLFLDWQFLPAPYAVPSSYELTIYDEGISPDPTGGTRYVMQGSGAVPYLSRSNHIGDIHYFHVVVTAPLSPPTCSITYTPSMPCPGQPILLDSHAQASAPATIASVVWSFGDGTTGTGTTATHSYIVAGSKTVTVVVTDNQGSTGTCSAVVTLPFISLPVCYITFTPRAPVTNQIVAFQLAGATEDVAATWSFGDGSSATGVAANHTYAAPGSYTVSATAEAIGPCGPDLAACSTTVTIRPNSPPTCSITYTPAGPVANETMILDSNCYDAEGDPVTATWDFGDGSTFGGCITFHRYAEAGTYQVSVSISDGTSTTVCQTTVIVAKPPNRPPTCQVTFEPAAPPPPDFGQQITFHANAVDPDTEDQVTSVTWDFGDGTTDTGHNVAHTYANRGLYDITVTVTSQPQTGPPQTGTCTLRMQIGQPPICAITYTPMRWLPGETVTFDSHAQAFAPATITSVVWNFGDGTTGTGITTTHIYTTSGLRTISATVTDSLGATVVCTIGLPVCCLPPTVSITSPADGATVSGSIVITAAASDPAGTVTQVEFFVDGMSVGVDSTAPYAAPPLDTTAYSDGAHAIAARATNNEGLTAWSHVVVRFSNAPPPTRPTFAFVCTRVSYSGGILVVRFRLTNSSAVSTAQAVSINSFTFIGTAASGAREALDATPVSGSFPKDLGDLAPGVSQTFDLQATIPADVTKVSRYMFVGQFTFGGKTYYF